MGTSASEPPKKPSGPRMAQTLAFEALPEADQQLLDNLAAQATGPLDTAPGMTGSDAPPPSVDGGGPRQAGSRGGRRRELASTIAFGAEEIEQAKQFAVDAAAKEAEAARAAAQAQAGPPSQEVPPSSEGGARTLAFEVPAHLQGQGDTDVPPSSEGGARTLAYEVPADIEEQAPTTPPLGAVAPVRGNMPEPDSTRTMAFGTDALPPQAGATSADAAAQRRRPDHSQTIAFSSEDVHRDRPLSQTVAFGFDALEADEARPSTPPEAAPTTQRPGEAPPTAGPRQGSATRSSKSDLSSTIAFAPDDGGQFEPAAPAPAKRKPDLASTMAFDAESVGVAGEQIIDESSHVEVPSARAARTKTMLGGMSAAFDAQAASQAQPAGTMVGLGQPAEVAAHPRSQAQPDAAPAAQAPVPAATGGAQASADAAMRPSAPMAPPAGYTTAPPPARTGGTKLLVAVVVGSVIVGVAVALGLRFAGVF